MLIPGQGEVEDEARIFSSMQTESGFGAGAEEGKKPAKEPPWADFLVRALAVSPKDPTELRQVARTAREYGLTHLWVCPLEDGSRQFLEEAVRIGKEERLQIVAYHRVLWRATEGDSSPGSDLSMSGENAAQFYARRRKTPEEATFPFERERLRGSGLWLRGDRPEDQQREAERLSSLLTIEGLAGVALADAIPPGYGDPGKQNVSGAVFMPDYGYVPELRLAFLREHGADPIDLVPPGSFWYANVGLPYFSENTARAYLPVAPAPPFDEYLLGRQWKAFRYAAQTDLLRALHARARQYSGKMGFWIADAEHPAAQPGTFSAWRDPDAGVREPLRMVCIRPLAWTHAWSKGSLPTIGLSAPAAWVREVLGRADLPEGVLLPGIVFDFTDLPVGRAVELLEGMKLPGR
jgi:hypothetical protein